MRKLFTIFLILAWLPIAHANDPEWDRALKAYEAGDYEVAFSIWKDIAEQGHVGAQYNIGLMYNNGQGVAKNYAEAKKWYRKAAEQGNAAAHYNIGLMYDKGEGVTQDYVKALNWYSKSAKLGDAFAQNNLAVLYYKGQGTPKNYIQAYIWASVAKARDDSVEDLLKAIEKEMTPEDISKAQSLATQCWESDYKNCGE